MSAKLRPTDTPAQLRRRAERDILERKPEIVMPREMADAQRLLHELEVHRIELEMQNAELRLARDEADSVREQYADLYDFAPVGYFTILADGTIRMVNLAGATLAGMVRSRLVGRSFEMLVAVDLRPVFRDYLQQVFAGGAAPSIDLTLSNGVRPERFVTVNVQRSPDGQECSAAVIDITRRKQDENAVRESETRYRRLFETAHDGVLFLDPGTHKVTDANPFVSQLLGYSHAQLIGRELFEIGLLAGEEASKKMFGELKKNHEARFKDLPLRTPDGGCQNVEVVATLYQEAGRPVVQCNIRDITARILTEKVQRNLDVMSASNLKLKQEIARRQEVEKILNQTKEEETRLLAQSRKQEVRLRDLSHQILHAQEEERKRISRELHDVVAQTLVGINVHVSALAQESGGDLGNLQDRITSTHRLVEKAVDIVHQFARELRPTVLDDLGLIPALRTHLKGFMEETGIRVGLKAFAGIEKAPEIIRTTFYRIAQEALVNVASHAKASAVEILIQSVAGSITLEITDDGQGFEANEKRSPKKHGRLGLIGMRERAEMIGGDFSIASAPGAPTTIRVVVKPSRTRPKAAPTKKAPAKRS